ncbi:primosomal protein N' [Candidatus Omnitrophota bacterium]
MSLYASIALPIPVNTLFTYKVPSDMAQAAEIGMRVVVPFGRRLLTGFIIQLSTDSGGITLSKIKPLQNIVDAEPVFSMKMIELAQWIADYYIATLGEVLKTAMPYSTSIQSQLRVHRTNQNETTSNTLSGRQKTVFESIDEQKTVSVKRLEQQLKFKVSGILRSLEKKGLVHLEYEIKKQQVGIKTERFVKPVHDAACAPPSRARKQAQCLEALRDNPDGVPLPELLERLSVSRGVVNALVDAGLAVYEDVEITRRTAILDQESIVADHPLTPMQQESFTAIIREAAGEKPRPILLKGVTGSGKTRVYIELVKEMIARGKGTLILVPEISLTPQTTRFFSSVFPDRVAVLHSAMSPGERYDAWRTIHDGGCDVVIGPRSAVFAPLPEPGIIIVDEEHDTSYKQTELAPLYHARDVAVVRANKLGIPVVLGSATPSLESWHNVSAGKYVLSVLSERIDSRPLPEVITVDMNAEWEAGNKSSLSRRLRDELESRIERGEKSIILINRRGFSSVIRCKSCGHVLTCPDCSAGLTYHSSKELAICHLCGHRQLVLEHCPDCGSTELRYRGTGTQRIEREIATLAGRDAVVRMDSDTTRAHDAHFRLLEEFREGPSPILLGTQMVAKGLDIPEVTLVGVVSADLSLFLPDFRAGERTFQLVTQVAGRAGRGDVPGKVIVQTANPSNYAIAAASKHDYETFAGAELAQRQEFGYPPFSRLILIEISSGDKHSLEKLSEDIAGYLTGQVSEGTIVMGPVEAPIARIRGKYRMHILIKSAEVYRLRVIIRDVLARFQRGREKIVVDVDPVDIM